MNEGFESIGRQYLEEEKSKEATQNISESGDQLEGTLVKKGVDFVFEQYPELISIGTQEQYIEYLETIFPESKFKEVVYHNSVAEFRDEGFKPRKPNFETLNSIEGVYNFSSNRNFTQRYGKNTYAVVLDIHNPIEDNSSGEFADDMDKPLSEILFKIGKQTTENPFSPAYDENLKNTDAVINRISGEEYIAKHPRTGKEWGLPPQTIVSVFHENQIHILGSTSDVQNFQEFVQKINKKEIQLQAKKSFEEAVSKDEKLPDEEVINDGLGILVRKKTLYHGSPVANINTFNPAEESTLGAGVYFTSQPDIASGYAERRSRNDEDSPTVHIRSIENLKLLDLRNESNLLKILPGFQKILIEERKRNDIPYFYEDLLDRKINEITTGSIHYTKEIAHQLPNLFSEYVKSLGYEGVIDIEGGEGEIGHHDTYLIFDPENIK